MGVLILPNECLIISKVKNKIWVDKTINSILSRTPTEEPKGGFF